MQICMYAVPPIGASVWVEFEGGDLDSPIWVGGWWRAGELPGLAISTPAPIPHIVFQTPGQNSLVISDAPGPMGGILLRGASGAMIQIDTTGIRISNGQGASIMLTGNTINFNQGALTVM
jgi:hypothetical protein